MLIVDTLGAWAGLRGDSENSSGDALAAIEPLQAAVAEGLSVVLVRHERKGGGDVGESGRGSSAFAGAVDVVLALRRGEGNSRKTVRVIHALSRYDETPETLVIELTDAGYVALGDEAAVAVSEARTAVRDALSGSENPLTAAELLTALSDHSRTTVQRALAEEVSEGGIVKSGAGKRGDPYRYSFHSAPSRELERAETISGGSAARTDCFRPDLYP